MISVSFIVVVFGHKKRQFECQRAGSLCLFCGEELEEEEEHMLWRCLRWETLRLEKQSSKQP